MDNRAHEVRETAYGLLAALVFTGIVTFAVWQIGNGQI